MEKRQQLIHHLEGLLSGPQQIILVSELMQQFDMSYQEVTQTIMEFLTLLNAPKVLNA